MNKLFILCATLFSVNILNAQTIKELEGRYTPPVKELEGRYTQPRSGWEKFVDTFSPEDDTWGLGYGYSQHFPLALSANYTHSCISIATEFGFNLDSKKYTAQEYNPSAYLVVSPGLYLRFLSINCGAGVMASDYIKTTYEEHPENLGGITQTTTTSISQTKYHFMLKPSITGYIPISDEDYYITINAGYNYIPKFKELNGWSFGIGFQWVIW